jgi:hypothetical protein
MENAPAYSIEVHIQRSIYRGSGLPYCIINYDNKKMWCGIDPWYINVFIYNCEEYFECKKFCNSDSWHRNTLAHNNPTLITSIKSFIAQAWRLQ